MKKTAALVRALIMSITVFLPGAFAQEEKLSVVTTIFPEYDWVMNVLGDNPADAEVTLLLDNGVDLHSFQPSADDILTISTCDMFVYVGGESDAWVDDALKEALNKDMVVINLMDILGDSVKEEEVVEGMQEEGEEEDETEYDEHVWLSLKNASLFVAEIADALGKKDTQHADAFKTNAAAYTDKLTSLDKQYQSAADSAKAKTLLFGDRFPFRYLTDDYKLDYYAAFSGCSAETEASFETIIFLADKVDELGLKTIMQIESSDGSIAKTIRDNTKSKDQEILTLNSMQSVTQKQLSDGETYLNIMQSNLEVLKKALE